MQVKGIDRHEVERIVDLVSDELYDGNIVVRNSSNRSNSRGVRSRFTIKAVSSRMPGARRSWSGRRMPVACWHAHWHVLDRLFRAHPDAEVRTSLAVYTAATFHDRAGITAFINVGSAYAPALPPELCDCHDTEWVNPTPIPTVVQIPYIPEGTNRVENYRLTVRPVPVPLPAKPLQSLEDRIAQEIADAEQTVAHFSNAYSWSAGTPHLYEEGLRG